jgi:hypothetical protein
VVLQAAMFDGLSLDPLALFDDGLGPAEIGVGLGNVVEALVVLPIVLGAWRRPRSGDRISSSWSAVEEIGG